MDYGFVIILVIVVIIVLIISYNNTESKTYNIILGKKDLWKKYIFLWKQYLIENSIEPWDIIESQNTSLFSKKDKVYIILVVDTKSLLNSLWDISSLLSWEKYLCRSELENTLNQYMLWYKDIKSVLKNYQEYIFFTDETKSSISKFLDRFTYSEEVRIKTNEEYVQNSLKKYKKYFDNLEKYPLEEKQRLAILHDEDNNLVVAWAGTWKTTTIAGKACFLIEKQKVDPSKILLLSFTKKAVEEMKDRISVLLSWDSQFSASQLMIKTFHAFWLYVTRNTDWKSDVLDDKETAYQDILENEFQKLCNDDYFLKILNEYFLYYMRAIPEESDFPTKDQYFKFLKKTLITLNQITVKSHEELQIANFLFMSWIDFKYESDYKFKTWTKDRRQYKPDFYLPNYDIYIEHFAINEDNTSPFEDYISGVHWKRNVHEKNNTNLIETYSYENSKWILITNLIKKLQKKWIKIREFDQKEIFEKIKTQWDWKVIHGFTKLLYSFLNLFKWSSKWFDELLIPEDKNKIRTMKFLEIFKIVFYNYQNYLKTNNMLDFNDMIVNAISYIESWKFPIDFDYILVDEFQDISLARYKLLKAIKYRKFVKLFCVWDDRQSIYRFNWSRIDIFTQFEEYFWFTYKSFLDKTYRFNKWICDISTKFITKNPAQLSKELTTLDQNTDNVIDFFSKTDDSDKDIKMILDKILLEDKREKISIYILVRYNFLLKKYSRFLHRAWKTFILNPKLKEVYPTLNIEFITDHKSKGKEADYVIIDFLDTSNKPWDFYGFPSAIEDDVIMDILLDNTDSYFHAEERRLFYVAFTRAKKKVYLLSTPGKESIFYEELLNEYTEWNNKHKVLCSNCWWEMLVRKNQKWDEFYGCSNYPICKETQNKI